MREWSVSSEVYLQKMKTSSFEYHNLRIAEHALGWKEILGNRIPDWLGREIDIFETEIVLRKQGKIDEKVFAERRLRRGIYGQRYDNGHRFDGKTTQKIAYPAGEIVKGPNTLWDAPGMVRIKIPYGGLSPERLETIAELAEEYSDGVLHVTTRQDIQLHFVHIDWTPALMRRLAAVGITTREACGNSVRNVTACPIAGVCRDETFDVTPYAHACFRFLLGHPDVQDFGRKFKIAFSGCNQHPCGLTSMHDMGFIAKTRSENGASKKGFEMVVGGGLGPVPYKAKLFSEFVPEEEMLPLAQSVARVFARLGEKKDRNRARIKFLVAKLGIDEFKRLVLEEREKLPPDPRWKEYFAASVSESFQETPLPAPQGTIQKDEQESSEDFKQWKGSNVYQQKQSGYAAVTVTLPLGDMTAEQARLLADLARRYAKGTIRSTVQQNVLFRWVREESLPELYKILCANGLGKPGADTLIDVTACPGTDTCKLGISSSRGLAAELNRALAEGAFSRNEAIKDLRIKVSGCFNSCGQHHIADIGFYGVSRNINGRTVPHFQLILGGQSRENAASYGMAVGAFPSKRVPQLVTRILDQYVRERQTNETFQSYVRRVGKSYFLKVLEDLQKIPAFDSDASFYMDWADSRVYTIGDMGKGECAGEIVPLVQFELSSCEREVFEAQVQLERKDYRKSSRTAYLAMLHAAKAVVKTQVQDVPEEPEVIVKEFRARFHETELFHDPFAGAKFARFLFAAHEEPEIKNCTEELASHRVEESSLFVEACYSCLSRMKLVQK